MKSEKVENISTVTLSHQERRAKEVPSIKRPLMEVVHQIST